MEHQPGRARDVARVASGRQGARLRPRRRHRGASPRRGRRDAARQQAARARGDQPALADRARVGRGARSAFAHQSAAARVHAPPRRSERGEGRRRRRRRGGAKTRSERLSLGAGGSLRPAGPTHRAGQRRRARDHRAGRVRGRTPGERGPDDRARRGDTGKPAGAKRRRGGRRERKKRVQTRAWCRRAARDGVARPLARARRVRNHGAVANERRGRRVGDDERNEIVAKRNRRVVRGGGARALLAARSRELRDIAAHAAALAAANDAVRERRRRRRRRLAPRAGLRPPCLCSRAARGRNTRRTRRLDDWRRARILATRLPPLLRNRSVWFPWRTGSWPCWRSGTSTSCSSGSCRTSSTPPPRGGSPSRSTRRRRRRTGRCFATWGPPRRPRACASRSCARTRGGASARRTSVWMRPRWMRR